MNGRRTPTWLHDERRAIVIGKVIGDGRRAQGIDAPELARLMGISTWTLSRVEHGKRTFDVGWLERMPAPIRAEVARIIETECRAVLAYLDRCRAA